MVEHKFQWKNDGRLKIMIGCGTRPEIIRLAAVMKRCREFFDTCIVYYNQCWGPLKPATRSPLKLANFSSFKPANSR